MSRGKIWVKYKEKFHGSIYHTWKFQPLRQAREEVRRWNSFRNPSEHLSIVQTSKKKPKGIKKTKYPGIYR